jgi:aquaporin Z
VGDHEAVVAVEASLGRRLTAEFLGTFWLVFGGCGAAVLAARAPTGIGMAGVALAFGLTVVTMAYAVGHLSGGHFNPAVTLGLWLGRRSPARDVVPYVVTQVVAAVAAAAVLRVVAEGRPGYRPRIDGLAANGYGAHSPDKYTLGACLVVEVLLTLVFVVIILGVTDRRAPAGLGPLAIGLALTVIHLISIPVTNTSVNPARSTGPALIMGGWALSQLWLFWLAPLLGGAIAGVAYRYLTGDTGAEPIAAEGQDAGAPAPRTAGEAAPRPAGEAAPRPAGEAAPRPAGEAADDAVPEEAAPSQSSS